MLLWRRSRYVLRALVMLCDGRWILARDGRNNQAIRKHLGLDFQYFLL